MKVSLFMSAALAAILTIGFSNCTKDDQAGTRQVSFEITDAPIDDANIQGVFVTITAVKVDGQAIDNFSGKQTIDLLAYQNGQVKALGSGKLAAGAYSDIRLVLDYNQDGNGAAPGCYVLTKDGVKHALQSATSATNELKIGTGTLSVSENSSSTAVLDVDLRKAIKYGAGSTAYQFVTDDELTAALRLAVKAKAGTIGGQVTDALGVAGSKIVVYAYKVGAYTDAEKTPQGSSGIMFKNAVCSALCDANGNYTLPFLEAGNYELHFVGYQDANNDGKLEEKGSLLLEVLGTLNLNSIAVEAGANVRLNVNVTGILPL